MIQEFTVRRMALFAAAAFTLTMLPACGAGEESGGDVAEEREEGGEGEESEEREED